MEPTPSLMMEDDMTTTTALDSPTFLNRRESASLFLFKTEEESVEAVAARNAERLKNQSIADKLADEEQQRRVEEEQDRENELAIVRQINIEYSIQAEEEEKERRVQEYELAKVQEQLLRERNKALAVQAAEEERLRRIQEDEEVQEVEEAERVEHQALADQAMERERVRRLSSSEHVERLAGLNLCDVPPPDAESILSTFSEIPVVQASASKILVDDDTEWRCFIQSENPEEEKENLRALRQSLEEELKDCKFQELAGDVRLLRFLRGHKQNVSTAATKYREMLGLRKQYLLDDIRRAIVDRSLPPDEFPGFQKIVPHLPFLHAYDLTDVEHDHVFYFEMTGYADFRGLLEQVSDDEWMQFCLYEMEYRAIRLDQLSRKAERMVQTIFVRDLSGFSIARFDPRILKRFRQIIKLVTTCYPETNYETLSLNMPWIFHKIWNAIKPMLQETQLSKIHMSATAYSHLVELVGGREPLPKLLGGKSTTHVIPQTGFLGRNSYLLLCEDGATQADIKAGGTLQLPFRIMANDTVCWEYEVKGHDIEFSVKLRTQGEGGAQEVDKVAKTRVAAGQTVAGSYTTNEEGTVVLSWDNGYSWTRGKTVAYKAKVVKATHDFSCLDISGNDCV
ncbi:hypothetical protein Poli38472_003629 [Pythium oligandrum]|uniref:CRAL-TRIO domain-containing protein n=1 Tax=Pythium oligandrum TaxID=41045 RepID=A0A8K1FM30_PYTOL|nr:hypothetical protein Poli38472_003629 [Pythium oligandrum]|eukprot:TMW65864.1 hypothetical protein Poli38472_003629 [Pythium oligandrum]